MTDAPGDNRGPESRDSATATAPATRSTYSQDSRSIAIQTPLGKDALLLRSFRGEEGISRLFRFELDLLSEQPSIDVGAIMGKSATVGIRLADGTDRFINGIISRLALTGAEGRFSTYHAELVPWTWLLTRTSDCRAFQNLAVPAIIEKVFKDAGFQDFANRLQRILPPREYTVQYRETDFNFVSRLMEQFGIFYFFEHENGKHTLVLADAETEHRPCPGLAQAKFRALGTGDYEPDVIRAWAIAHEIRPAKYSLAAYNFETPNANLLVNVESIHATDASSRYEIYDYPGDFQKRDEGEKLVSLRIEEQESQVVTIHGAATCRALESGYRFELVDHPQSAVNQNYVVTTVSHAVSETSYLPKEDSAAGRYQNAFTAIPLGVPFRPPRITPRPVIHGVQTAIVVGKKGEELWVDKYGRVKVQFHWDREGKNDENSSCWIRVSQNWAGKRWGAMFLPRIGQEVIVEFLEGDPDCPIITGRVYNADQTTPYDLPAEQTKTALKSSSSKGGGGFNELRFEDKKGSEQIFIHGQRDLDFVIEAESRELVQADRHLIVKHDRIEQAGNEQHLKVGADMVEEIGGGRYIDAKKGLFVTAGGKLMLNTDGEITLRAAGGFITIGAEGINIQGKLVNINSGGTAAAAATKVAKLPHRASSAGVPEGAGLDPTDGTTQTQDPDLLRVELYRKVYEENSAKMSEKDRKDYQQALAELEDATAKKDPQAIAAAKAKLDAILTKNGIAIPPDPALAAGGAGAVVPGGTGVRTGPGPVPTRLRTDGPIFRTEDGLPWRWKGVSAFQLLDRFAKGENISPFLDAYAGFNVLRVWPYVPVADWGARAWDSQDPATTLKFVQFCQQAGFYVELTLLTDDDSRRVGPARDLVTFLAQSRPPNLLIEIGNEPTTHKTINTPALRAACEASGFLYASGDYEDSARFFGSFLTAHTSRDDEWPRRAHDLMEYYGGGGPNAPTDPPHKVPCVADEPIRPDQARGNREQDFLAYYGTCSLLGAGATFHTETGKFALPPSADERRLAAVALQALDAFPADAPKGGYRRPVEQSLRTYVVGGCMVRVRPTSPAAPEAGWKSLDAGGVLWVRG